MTSRRRVIFFCNVALARTHIANSETEIALKYFQLFGDENEKEKTKMIIISKNIKVNRYGPNRKFLIYFINNKFIVSLRYAAQVVRVCVCRSAKRG